MAYRTIKKCANSACEVNFICNSNKQAYCKPCIAERRKGMRSDWNHKYNMKITDKKNEESRAYNKTEKGRAAQKLRDAVRQGKIKRQPCEICQEPEAQGHHFDYSKPLEVRWLCPKHHREEHLFEPWQNELRRAGYTGSFELSQLIEACGDNDAFLLYRREAEGVWTASGSNGESNQTDQDGPTPTEAVARLWLALNNSTSKT